MTCIPIRNVIAVTVCLVAMSASSRAAEYRAGLAARQINPRKPTVIIGPASSPVLSGRYNDLHVKCTVIEDSAGRRIAFVSADILHFEAAMVDELKAKISDSYALPPASVLLNASHNHSGPPLSGLMVDTPEKVDPDYIAHFKRQIVGVVGDAIGSLRPAALSWVEDTCDVAINRRRVVNGRASVGPNPDGSVDRAAQVLAIGDPDGGKLFGLVVKYACHPVTTSMFAVGASFPGFMTDELERRHAGVTAQFLQGCAGDCRPRLIGEDKTRFIRGTIEMCRGFGLSLADAVDRALGKPGMRIAGPNAVRYREIQLPIRVASRGEMERFAKSKAWHLRRWADEHLRRIDAGERLPTTVPFRVQVFRLGAGEAGSAYVVAFDGEIFSGYSHRIQERLRPTPTMALGYSNAMAGYIPTAAAMPEGGYEVGAYRVWNTPGPFLPEIEPLILDTAQALAGRLQTKPTAR